MKLFSKKLPHVESFHPLADGMQPRPALSPLAQGAQQGSVRSWGVACMASAAQNNARATQGAYATAKSPAPTSHSGLSTPDSFTTMESRVSAPDSGASSPRSFVTTASEAAHPVNAQALTRALQRPAAESIVHKVLTGQVTRAQVLEQLEARLAAVAAQPAEA